MNAQIYASLDAPFERTNTESVKWDLRKEFGNASALPMWVADMDFPTAPGVIEGLTQRTAHGAFGYSIGLDKDKQALVSWFGRRHDCSFTSEDVLFCPGVVDALYHALKALFEKGSRIIVQSPVYKPFFTMCEKAGMQVIESPLINSSSGWKMDFEGLESLLKQGAQGLILCSPHNPVGRVWTREELETLAKLCEKYGTRIISDEIHADFELGNSKHTCILSLENAHNAVMLVSATKTFNLAALRHSAIIVKDAEARQKISARLDEAMVDVNLFGRLATRFAYEKGEEWLDTLNFYLTENRDALESGILSTGVLTPSHTEGTYLMWVDCRKLGLKNDALKKYFIEEIGIIPNDGCFFGANGEGFVRLNFATRRANIYEAISRIKKAVK